MANLQPMSPTVPGFCLTPIALLSHKWSNHLAVILKTGALVRIQRGQWDLLCLYYVSLLNSLTPTTNYYHYTSAFLVAAVGLPFVSLAL